MPEEAARREWAALLDRFEQDLAGEPRAWTPPAAPLPPELADRAGRVLEAQRERIAALAAARDETLAQLVALRRVPTGDDRPVYLDRAG
ncbi:hypothetical protein [Microbacterium sediminis]|uniref:Uncharacterized protein n=1 Tax=Microbacterium sediminis TaxID=904291 RepID=A0A1B9NIX3_9MICO|nr:hypothetical protein [Microbacterium sediminis]OCG76558.1 hypothetical protein A7J15_11280 [Microbacterium sediminis]QBR73838.1 hypothetical protein E3O41_04970 [Microbacterium sediminis]